MHNSEASPRHRRLARTGPLLVLLSVLLAQAGCSRAHYRVQADDEVYCLVDRAAVDPRWELQNFTIDYDLRSRMFDPYSPDHPPMPPDDPTAHRLMHCVDCKRGAPCWHCNGDAPQVESPYWQAFLPRNDQGVVVLDLKGAVETSLINSRDYQRQLENLYLSALDVTFERFRFDTQFYGGHSTFFTADGRNRFVPGGESSSLLEVNVSPTANRWRATKLFAAGGELVVGLANSLVWEFSGPDQYSALTVVDFSMIQPLLRAGGRAVVLENLTEVERALLGNIRQFERFRRGFYVDIVAGRTPPRGPVATGFSFLDDPGIPNINQAGGYLGLLQDLQEIRNQEANVASLQASLEQLEAVHAAGRIDRFQVDLTRQALYNAQSALLTRKAQYQTTLDAFKFRLGLPPQLELGVEDSLLEPFNLIDPDLTSLQNALDEALAEIRSGGPQINPEQLEKAVTATKDVGRGILNHLDVVDADFKQLQANLPRRREQLRLLADRPEVRRGEVEDDPLSVTALDNRVATLEREYVAHIARLQQTLDSLDQFPELQANWTPRMRQDLLTLATTLSDQLLELTLIQARTRLDAVVLNQVALESNEAIAIARENRLDWMNARAALVDQWRLIRVTANALKAGLNLIFNGDIRNEGNDPLNLNSNRGRLQVGVEFDAPLTRLIERNEYRAQLIAFQRARRAYYTFEDRVSQSLRETIRTIRLADLNFEIRRAAIHLAISQVDITRLRLSRPPRPGEGSEQLGDTTARDLLQSLGDLLQAQNDFLRTWVSYEVQRMSLDLDMGTMRLDPEGIWIDPGPAIGEGFLPAGARTTTPEQFEASEEPELKFLQEEVGTPKADVERLPQPN